jgi:hypothetical protein
MENKPNYYANIPANVRYDKNLCPSAKLLYGEITALCNAEGYCWATNSYFMEIYEVTKRSVQLWLSQLEKKGYIRVVIIDQGHNSSSRRIYLNFTGEENYTGGRKNVHEGHDENFTHPHEENYTHNTTSINTTINTTSNNKKTNKKESNSFELEREFEQLWKTYPRKMGKANAQKSYIKARKKEKIPYKTIENGIYRYIDYLELQGTDEQYIMHGSTWFSQMKWQDEYTTTGLNRKPKNATEYLRAKYGGEPYEPRRNRKIIEHDPEIISESF